MILFHFLFCFVFSLLSHVRSCTLQRVDCTRRGWNQFSFEFRLLFSPVLALHYLFIFFPQFDIYVRWVFFFFLPFQKPSSLSKTRNRKNTTAYVLILNNIFRRLKPSRLRLSCVSGSEEPKKKMGNLLITQDRVARSRWRYRRSNRRKNDTYDDNTRSVRY